VLEYYVMKTYWGSVNKATPILNLGIRWRRVVSFMPRPFYPQTKSPCTHWIGGWVVPRAVLDTVVKRKIPSHLGILFLIKHHAMNTHGEVEV
jgi:hypothetical protein